MRRYAYEVWDVFTRTPLTGNPLTVVLDGATLSSAEMQAIARETNHSETTFLLGRTAKGHRVRIFSPVEEYPFAGHPVLGSAAAIRQRIHEQRIVLDLNVGPVPVDFEETGYGEMLQPEPQFGERLPRETVARWLGIPVDDLAADLPIESVSTGRPNFLVPVRTLAAIRALKVDWPATGGRAFYFLSLEPDRPDAKVFARKISARSEDPATGSAAGCAAAWMVAHGLAKPGERVTISQGAGLGRPSQITVSAQRRDAKVTEVRVGGHTALVARGEFLLP